MRTTGSTASMNKLYRTLKASRTICTMALDFQTVLDVGSYIGQHLRPRPCEVECPYCHVAMVEAQPTEPPKRIVKVLRRLRSEPGTQRADVMASVIPDTYRIVGCRHCRSVFTVPKSFESAMSVDVVDPHVNSTGKPSPRVENSSGVLPPPPAGKEPQ